VIQRAVRVGVGALEQLDDLFSAFLALGLRLSHGVRGPTVREGN